MNSDSPVEPSTSPGIASAEDGYVILDGPDGLAMTLTIEAAIRTAESLSAAAEKARGQRDVSHGRI